MVAYHHIDCILVYDMRAVGRRDDQHVSKAPFTVIVSSATASATEINVFIFLRGCTRRFQPITVQESAWRGRPAVQASLMCSLVSTCFG